MAFDQVLGQLSPASLLYQIAQKIIVVIFVVVFSRLTMPNFFSSLADAVGPDELTLRRLFVAVLHNLNLICVAFANLLQLCCLLELVRDGLLDTFARVDGRAVFHLVHE